MKKLFLLTIIGLVNHTLLFGQTLSASAGKNVSICAGNSVRLNGSASGGTSPYTFQWSPGNALSDSTIVNPNASPTVTTVYFFHVRDNNGDTAVDTIVVTVNQKPHAYFTVDTSFTNCPPLLCHFNDSTSTPFDSSTFYFDFGDGYSTNSPLPIHLYTNPGNYFPYLIITNPGGCSDTFHLSGGITIGGPVVTSESASSTSGCVPLIVYFTTISNGIIDTITKTFSFPGIYYPFIILSNGQCNFPYFLDTINVYQDTISIIPSNPIICRGDSIQLNCSGASFYTIKPQSIGATDSAFLIGPVVNTTYTIIGTDTHGCMDSITTTVSVDTNCISLGVPIVKVSPPFNLNVYPNPSSDKVVITSNNSLANELVLRNILGEIVLSIPNPKQKNIVDVSQLPSDVYILTATFGNSVAVKKLIIQK